MAANLDDVRRALEAHLGAWLEQLLIRAVVEGGFAPAHVYVEAEFRSREEVQYRVRVGAPVGWDTFGALLEAARAVGARPVGLDATEARIEILMRAPIPDDVRRLARF